MTSIAEKSLASIVTEHHQAARVLEKHNLDFCCKGKRTLSQACNEKGLPIEEILRELNESFSINTAAELPFEKMSATSLIGHILIRHHFYVKQTMPQILQHLEKVAAKHGDRFPYMIKVFQLFTAIAEEMTLHMKKEEMILFPRIKEAEKLLNENNEMIFSKTYLQGPIHQMEAEHDHAGELMYEIRQLTHNYTPPEDACTTFRVCLSELKEFEQDLHQHVHLENNMLFPLTEKLMTLAH